MTDYHRDCNFSHSPRDPEGRPYGEADPKTLDWSQARPLLEHLEGAAEKARDHGKKLGLGDYAYWAGLWHDLGKYRPNFQDYLRGLARFANSEDKSHKWAGAVWADALQNGGLPIAWLIGSHHGGLYDFDEIQDILKSEWAKKELAEVLATGRVPQELLQKPTLDIHRYFYPDNAHVSGELLLRFLFSMLVDADHSDTAAHFDPERKTTHAQLHAQQNTLAELKETLDSHMAGFKSAPDTPVNRMRAQVLAHCREAAAQTPGCFSLSVPTGGGKTLASMAFALDHAAAHAKDGKPPFERVIIVLPFTSIIEQSAKVYRDIFGEANVLEHHANWEPDEQEEGARRRADYRHKLLCENWGAPIIVTTAVQFLETLHSHKPCRCRKLHRVLNSIVIMDEVQTLPVHLLHVTLDTLAGLVNDFRTSLVLCTATQPALSDPLILQEEATLNNSKYYHLLPQPRPIIPAAAERALFEQMRRVRVHPPLETDHPSDWEDLVNRVKGYREVLVIVDRRQAAYDLAKKLGDDWLVLSGSMLPVHRSAVIAEVKRRLAAKEPCRLVSTQIIEAGVDIDFPIVYRALAGYEALAQSAGRCNRNGLRCDKPGQPVLGDFHVFLGVEKPPPGILKKGFGLAQAGFRKGPVELGDPTLFAKYFRSLYRTTDKDTPELMDKREKMALRQIGEGYRVIDNKEQVQVVVPLPKATVAALYPPGKEHDKAVAKQKRTIDAFKRFRKKGKPQAGDMRLLCQAMVGLPAKVARALVAEGAVLPLHQNCLVLFLDLETFPKFYDRRLGFAYFEDYEVPDPWWHA